jgi:hypothetical protein
MYTSDDKMHLIKLGKWARYEVKGVRSLLSRFGCLKCIVCNV